MRIDVGRVHEKVRTKIVLHLGGGQLDEIIGYFLLCVAPGEISVGLRKADLYQAVHHLRACKGFRQENHVGMARTHFSDQPFPERERLSVRIVDAKDANAFAGPIEDRVTQREPKVGDSVCCIKFDVDDVLVFLRRVFGIAYRTVRAPVEPPRMVIEPRMIRRALDREIKRELQAAHGGCFAQPPKIADRTEFTMDRVVAAFAASDGVWTPDIGRLAAQVVVLTLAICQSDRVNWREIKNVKAHITNVREEADHAVESAVT